MSNKLNRAAQFAPFDALKGLQDELRRREEIHSRIERKELDEAREQEISNMLQVMSIGYLLSVDFFYNGHYLNIVGHLLEKNSTNKYILVEETKISFADLYDIRILER